MRVYCRPGATPLEQLEARLAAQLCSRPEIPQRVADLLVWVTDSGPARERAIRDAFPAERIGDPAEALGIARVVLLLCGIAPESKEQLSGDPKEDLANLLEGQYRTRDLASPSAYAFPSLLEAYCHMGAGFARGVDRVFRVVTGQPLSEHVRRALVLLEPSGQARASG